MTVIVVLAILIVAYFTGYLLSWVFDKLGAAYFKLHIRIVTAQAHLESLYRDMD